MAEIKTAAFVLIINAEDGLHHLVYRTEAALRRALVYQLGYEPEAGCVKFVDEWGRRMVAERRPAGWTAAKETRVALAFDDRECGLATAAQTRLLAEFEGTQP